MYVSIDLNMCWGGGGGGGGSVCNLCVFIVKCLISVALAIPSA